MWCRIRWWKHFVVPPLFALGVILLPDDPSKEPMRSALGSAVLFALALGYIVEELFWNYRGKGRPCPHCGNPVRVRSFRLIFTCPHCGKSV